MLVVHGLDIQLQAGERVFRNPCGGWVPSEKKQNLKWEDVILEIPSLDLVPPRTLDTTGSSSPYRPTWANAYPAHSHMA